MVERWNIGIQKDISHFNIIANPACGGTINPTLPYPRTHYSTIPLFHHSNCERSELTCLFYYQFTTEVATVFVFARSQKERDFARELGAYWAGATERQAPEKLDCIIDTTDYTKFN